ncbi:MAG TPA: dipeptide epimerase [Candidatus Binatia bacterium]|nr:dipeptide epimerase [Candidatus Binatia bacterium]
MNLELAAGPLTLRGRSISIPYRDPFRIARSHEDDGMSSVLVELRHRGLPDLVGYGEGYPDAYYGETIETMAVVLPLLLAAVDPAALDADVAGAEAALASAGAAFEEAIAHHGAAKCALDIALHDLVAKRLGLPVHRLLGLSADIPPTDFTLGLDEPAVVAARAQRAAGFPALKIKVGGPHDIETLEAVRRVYGGRIRVDANTGWQPDEGARLIPDLVRLGVELIEQPFPRHRLDQLGWLQERSELPVVADESAVTIDDLDGLVGVVAGVNVKLAKCGGVGPAKRMLERARDLGFRRFEGCMEETSVAISASAAVASLADWVDLDGCLLIAEDPFEGLELDEGHRWRLTDAPGLGVRPVA